MNKNIFFDISYKIIIFLIIAFAIILRTITYLYNRSLWHDEASLALNIINNVNYFQPLLHNQFAPQIFMYFTKLNVLLFGNNELVLRFLPFSFGILSVILFYFFSKEFLEKKLSIIIANFLFAINYHIIYYCQEFKQYSSDIFFYMTTLLILSKLDIEKNELKSYFIIGFLLISSTMISLPILFNIAAWFIFSILKYKKSAIKKIIKYLPLFLIFFVYYFLVLVQAKYNVDSFNPSYWSNGYIKFNNLFIIIMIKNIYKYCFEPNIYLLFLFFISLWGWIIIIKNAENKIIYFFTILSLVFMLVSSYLKMYPLDGRTILFFIPIMIITIVIPLDKIKWNYLFLLFLIFCLSSYNFQYLKIFFNPNIFLNKNAREITRILKEKYEVGDTLIYNAASTSGYKYYTNYFDLSIKKYAVVQLPNVDFREKMKILQDSLSYLPKNKTYIFYLEYEFTTQKEIFLFKEWLKNKNKLWEYEINGSYIAKIKY